jgi:hypothetical protein
VQKAVRDGLPEEKPYYLSRQALERAPSKRPEVRKKLSKKARERSPKRRRDSKGRYARAEAIPDETDAPARVCGSHGGGDRPDTAAILGIEMRADR